ncbi:MAG: ATP synthase F1 subunit gamma [Anaeroplasmataceae bacterium]|jgi:ATP synthase, F1 gamma subunit|nr:ATP synthase F1 subunit gamma [Anaeroplasmataceae bacterium]
MANSLREVKQRIQSTENTAQITKAMYMVSSSKVKKAERIYKGYQDFMLRKANLVHQMVAKASEDFTHPLLTERPILRTAFLLVTSDRGLAGSYNSSIYKALEEKLNELNLEKQNVLCGAIGKQGFAYLKRNKYNLIKDTPTLVRDDVMFIDILPLAKSFIESYLLGEIDKLIIVYNHYINSLSLEIRFEELLPIMSLKGKESSVDYIYETGIEKTLNLVLPMYIEDMIYGIILDAKVSEHSARMNSMRNATDNATEVIAKLQLLYNRARQGAITTELIDIIGGANAIGGDA